MSNAVIPFAEVTKMAAVAASSRMFGFKTQDEALAIMLLCQGEGLHPAVAMRDYHVISGRPSMKADAMLARFQQAGGSVKWTRYDETAVSGVFSHPQGGSVEITWNMEQAKRANLSGKDVWKAHPRAMLRARCISEGIRTVFPACIVGVYTPEEIQAMPEPVAVQSHVVEEPPAAPPAQSDAIDKARIVADEMLAAIAECADMAALDDWAGSEKTQKYRVALAEKRPSLAQEVSDAIAVQRERFTAKEAAQ